TGQTPKGYKREQFERAWERYLAPLPREPEPPPPPEPPFPDTLYLAQPLYSDDFAATPPQGQDFCGFEPDFEPPHEGACGSSEIAENPSVSAVCSGVADKTADIGELAKQGALNGLDTTAPSIEDEAHRLAADHPDWSISRIRKALGQPERRIK